MDSTRIRAGASGLTKVGLLGGSFNPAHGGHRAISLRLIEELGLDELWWLVSPGNPLKSKADMAPLPVRLASAQKMARRTRIRPTVIEQQFGTCYTVDTLTRLQRRYRELQFIWIMGGDNMGQFDRWRRWRDIAKLMPIAVVARPRYDAGAIASPAMAWFRRYVRRPNQRRNWTEWSTPALVLLRFRPDKRSATAIRLANPQWSKPFARRRVRDAVTHRLVR